MSQKHLDQECIRATYGNDEIARAILDYVATRKRSPNALSAEVVQDIAGKAGVSASYDQCVAALRSLSECGAGQFLVGRRGKMTRLRFHLDARMVGEVARGTVSMPQLAPVGASSAPQREVSEAPSARSTGLDLSALRTMPEDELRRVIAYANKVLELTALEQGDTSPLNGRPYGRRRADLREGAGAH